MKIKKYEFYGGLPFYFDVNEQKIGYKKFQFNFEYLKNKPCQTRWLYDWILRFGWMTIMKSAPEHIKVPTPECTCGWGNGWLELWHHASNCQMNKEKR